MRLVMGAFILVSAVQAQAVMNDYAKYIPSQVDEKVGAISMNVKTAELGFNCEIGLREIRAANITTKPGSVVFENYAVGSDAEVTVNLAHTRAFQELLSMTDKIVISNFSEPITGQPEGFISYDLRALESDHPDRLAYQGSFYMQLPEYGEGFKHVGGGPYNQRAIYLVNSLCNHARLKYNSQHPGIAVTSLGRDAMKAAITPPTLSALPAKPIIMKKWPHSLPAQSSVAPAKAPATLWERFKARFAY